MKLPKVLIFTPIYEAKDYSLNKFLACTKKQTYKHTEHIFIDNSKTDDYYKQVKRKIESFGHKIYHIERGANSREALARSQNFARRKFLSGDYDYLFSWESDIYPPDNMLADLLRAGKRVITALYHIGDRSKGQRVPCITIPEFSKELQAWGTRLLKLDEFKEFENAGILQVQAGGFGTCLIERQVVEGQPFFYDPRFQGHSDIYFFNKMFIKKIPVFVNTDIICEHENTPWNKVEDR
jgi:glycosyltransferase involved in cell wall biosynthesis